MAPDGWKEGVTWVQISHPSNSLSLGVGGIVLTCPAWLGGPLGTAGSERPVWVCLARPQPGALPPGTGCPLAVGREASEPAHLPGLSIALPAAHPREPGRWRASPLSNSVQAREEGWGERVWRAGDPRRAAGGPEVGFGQAFPPQQGQGHPGFCLKTCEPARDNVGRGGKAKKGKSGCGGWSPCQMIQPLPSEF